MKRAETSNNNPDIIIPAANTIGIVLFLICNIEVAMVNAP